MQREYITLNGSCAEIVKQIVEKSNQEKANSNIQLTEENVKQFLEEIWERRSLLSSDEEVESLFPDAVQMDTSNNYLAADQNIYISLRKATLAIILGVLPSYIPVELLMEFFGITSEGTFFTRLNEKEGETCILCELSKCGKGGADKNLLNRFKGECINNQYQCNIMLMINAFVHQIL